MYATMAWTGDLLMVETCECWQLISSELEVELHFLTYDVR